MNLVPSNLSGLMEVQDKLLSLPQIEIPTEHVFHAGMYARTIILSPEAVVIGALIKIPTLLIISGAVKVYTGDGWIELRGYHVIPAEAGRKQIFVAIEETEITMIFATEAKNIEEAEEEFTPEHELLMSRSRA